MASLGHFVSCSLFSELHPKCVARKGSLRKIGCVQNGGGDLDLEQELNKVMSKEESKALLKDLAAATVMVDDAKRKMALFEAHEREMKAEIKSEEQIQAEAFMRECEAELVAAAEEVKAAAEEVKAAEIALIEACAIESSEEVQRVESGKAAAVAAIVGTVAGLPLIVADNNGLGLIALISIGTISLSTAVFGVTYRYIIRRDMRNIQLKLGSAAGFALVRGIGQMEALVIDESIFERIFFYFSESFIIFFAAALALDYCIQQNMISSFTAPSSSSSSSSSSSAN